MLPSQYTEFRRYFESVQRGRTRTYIVKPEADCQGRGIFLTRNIEGTHRLISDVLNGNHYVVQKYMTRPFLLEGLKFDFRIYVLLAGTEPLRVYLYD
jgi:tubulin polyglutamylase TTLL6/13